MPGNFVPGTSASLVMGDFNMETTDKSLAEDLESQTGKCIGLMLTNKKLVSKIQIFFKLV